MTVSYLTFVSWESRYCLAQSSCSVTAEFTNELIDHIGEDENLTQGDILVERFVIKAMAETSCACLRMLHPSGMEGEELERVWDGLETEEREQVQELDWFLPSLVIHNR